MRWCLSTYIGNYQILDRRIVLLPGLHFSCNDITADFKLDDLDRERLLHQTLIRLSLFEAYSWSMRV